MNLYKLATGVSTNIKNELEKKKSKKTNKDIFKNIKLKNKKLKIIENKTKDKLLNKNIQYNNNNNENDDKEEQKINKEEREMIAYKSGEHFGRSNIIDPVFDN